MLSTPAMRPAGRGLAIAISGSLHPRTSAANPAAKLMHSPALPGTHPAQLAALSSSLAGHILDPLSGEESLRRRSLERPAWWPPILAA